MLMFRLHRARSAAASIKSTVIEPLECRQLLTAYYVSPSGANNNPGTVDRPWQTVGKVDQFNFKAGDQILFQGGFTYSESTLYLNQTDGGSAAAPIHISSYGTGRATIAGPGTSGGFYGYNTAGIEIDNINFAGSGAQSSLGGGIFFYNDRTDNAHLSYIRISNVDVSGFQYGIEIGGGAISAGFEDVRVTNVTLHDNGRAGMFTFANSRNTNKNIYVGHVQAYNNPGINPATLPSGTVTGHGIVLGQVDGATVERSIAHDNGALGDGGAGIWCYDSNNVLFQYNESYNNRTVASHDGDGFDFDRNTSNSIMQYNYSHGNDGGGFLLSQREDNTLHTGNVIRYNISQNDGRKNSYGGIHMYGRVINEEVYQNTIYMTLPASGTHAPVRIRNTSLLAYQAPQHVHIRNNIFQTTGGLALIDITPESLGNSIDLTFQGNDYWSSGSAFKIVWGNTTYSSFSSWVSASGREKVNSVIVGLNVDPGYSSPGGGTTIGNADNLATLSAYKLQSTSALVNAGQNLTNLGLTVGGKDFWGDPAPQQGAFDIGADESPFTRSTITSSISGKVYNDVNGNGALDSGEVGLSDRTVYIDANNNSALDTGEKSNITDTSGNYSLTGLNAGTYKLRQVLPSGWSQTFPANGFGINATVSSGQTLANQNFGAKQNSTGGNTASISGQIYDDVNGNLVKDSTETGINGRTLYLDTNNNSIKDTGEVSTTTDSSGNYKFSSLAAGTYKVREILPSGWQQTTPTSNFGIGVTLTSGQAVTGKNFGARATPAGTASISGNVFHDFDRDGTKDSGDSGIGGWKLYIDTNNNGVMDSNEQRLLTDSSGNYKFINLAPGTYKVREVLQSGYIQTTPTSNFGQTVTVSSGQSATGKNFGVDN